MGFMKALAETGVFDELAAVSSVSGGSWFTAQYTFSSSFQDAVNDPKQSAADMYTSWLEKYYDLENPADNNDSVLATIQSDFSWIPDMKEITGFLTAARYTFLHWPAVPVCVA